MSEDRLLKKGDILKATYEVEMYLGGGAFGEVYRVKHNQLKNRFAVKVFKEALNVKGGDSTVQDMLDEAIILAKFDHRNIVKVHDAGTFKSDDGQEYVFFVMDYIPGGDLDDYWKSFGSRFMPIDTVIDIIKQICLGLNVLHKKNPPMIHRDIKPQNIMIGYDDEGIVAKLTDFGLVKKVNPATLYASAKGTLAFKAPEFLKEIDNTSTDIFAVGVTFYLLLTDKLPYPVDSELEALTGKWLDKTPKPINYYNPLVHDDKLENIVFTAISTDPDKRYKNAQELLDAIIDWEETKDQQPQEEISPVEVDDEPAIAKIAKFSTGMKTKEASDALKYAEEVEMKFAQTGEIDTTSDLFAMSLNDFIQVKAKGALDGDLDSFISSLGDLMKLIKIAEVYATKEKSKNEIKDTLDFLKRLGAEECEDHQKPEPVTTPEEQSTPEEPITQQPTTQQETITPEEPITTEQTTPDPSTVKTEKTLPGPSFIYTSDALAQIFSIKDIPSKEEKIPTISSKTLIKRAFNLVSNLMNYKEGIKLLQQVFEQNPEYRNEYGYKLELWKCFSLIQNPHTIDQGIYNLRQLVNEDELVKKDYEFTLDIISTKDARKIENEAMRYINSYDTEKGSTLIEIAMLMDENIKTKYQYKIKNWKRGIVN